MILRSFPDLLDPLFARVYEIHDARPLPRVHEHRTMRRWAARRATPDESKFWFAVYLSLRRRMRGW